MLSITIIFTTLFSAQSNLTRQSSNSPDTSSSYPPSRTYAKQEEYTCSESDNAYQNWTGSSCVYTNSTDNSTVCDCDYLYGNDKASSPYGHNYLSILIFVIFGLYIGLSFLCCVKDHEQYKLTYNKVLETHENQLNEEKINTLDIQQEKAVFSNDKEDAKHGEVSEERNPKIGPEEHNLKPDQEREYETETGRDAFREELKSICVCFSTDKHYSRLFRCSSLFFRIVWSAFFIGNLGHPYVYYASLNSWTSAIVVSLVVIFIVNSGVELFMFAIFRETDLNSETVNMANFRRMRKRNIGKRVVAVFIYGVLMGLLAFLMYFNHFWVMPVVVMGLELSVFPLIRVLVKAYVASYVCLWLGRWSKSRRKQAQDNI